MIHNEDTCPLLSQAKFLVTLIEDAQPGVYRDRLQHDLDKLFAGIEPHVSVLQGRILLYLMRFRDDVDQTSDTDERGDRVLQKGESFPTMENLYEEFWSAEMGYPIPVLLHDLIACQFVDRVEIGDSHGRFIRLAEPNEFYPTQLTKEWLRYRAAKDAVKT